MNHCLMLVNGKQESIAFLFYMLEFQSLHDFFRMFWRLISFYISLHAHVHLAQQVRRHGGLAHTSTFGFESCIRFLEAKAHGSKNLASQIDYWINLQSIMELEPLGISPPSAVNVNKFSSLFSFHISLNKF